MGRPKKTEPKYCFHVSGQAVVQLDYKDFYLGEYGSPESKARYYSLLAEYNANGLVAPESPRHQKDEPVRVRDVTADYRQHCAQIYSEKPEPRLRLAESMAIDESPNSRKLVRLR